MVVGLASMTNLPGVAEDGKNASSASTFSPLAITLTDIAPVRWVFVLRLWKCEVVNPRDRIVGVLPDHWVAVIER